MQIEKLHSIKNCHALVFGDLMVDKYIIGKVKRIAADSPVPILEVKEKTTKLGGAGNVVDNVIALGASARVLGCVGDDNDGRWILEQLSEKNVDMRYTHMKSSVQTIIKTRILSKNQQYVRLDEEHIEDVPEEYAEFIKDNIDKILSGIDVVIIADYNKGTITKDLAQYVINTAGMYKIPVVINPRGEDHSKYYGATVLTPNVNELSFIMGKSLETEEELSRAAFQIREELNLNYLMLTKSEKGISVYNSNGNQANFPAVKKDVVDATGISETVVAVTGLCLGVGYEIEDCSRLVNIAASIVCSKFGAATVSVNEILDYLIYTGEFKTINSDVAGFTAESLREKGKKLVFTYGFYDLLHAGHVAIFTQAKAMGDVLMVAVSSDEATRRLLGETRPIISEKNRMAMLCGLESIDYIMLLNDDTPVDLIEKIRPDVVVKGRDAENSVIHEKEIVESYGGELRILDIEQGVSTTNIISKIVENNINK